MTRRFFVTDCEGPVSLNDNAFELSKQYIPDGDRLFTTLSRYDDVLADIRKLSGYSAGYTLKLIAPFLKAYGATNQGIREFSRKHILFTQDAPETLHLISTMLPCHIISTSYEQYIEALCKEIDLPVSNASFTHLDLDSFRIDDSEANRIRELKEDIVKLPEIEIPKGAKRLKDLSEEGLATINRLDEIFFSELTSMNAGRLLEDVKPIGSKEKLQALHLLAEQAKTTLDNFIYVGDSITDVEILRAVKRSKGLSVAFNGNQYAVRNADLAVISESALPIALIAEAFKEHGRKGVFSLVNKWPGSLHGLADSKIAHSVLSLNENPILVQIRRPNMKQIAEESNNFRKKVRGKAIGSLG
jgi:energy-converting hydrogenase A subunit R